MREAIDFVAGVHPRFDRAKCERFLANTKLSPKLRVREMSKGMIVQLHLALVMAIDARLLVLDEPTLGLDILYRKEFYQRLLEDYFDEQKTIVITTHQVEEIEHILTDVLFIRDGRIVLSADMEHMATRYTELLVPAERIDAARALQPIDERGLAVRQVGVPVRRRAAGAAGRARRNPHSRPGRPVRRHHEGHLRMNAPAKTISPVSTFTWLLKREFWEHRGGFLWAPVITGGIVAALYTVLSIIGSIAGRNHGGGSRLNDVQWDGQAQNAHQIIGAVGDGTMLAGVLLASIVVGFVVFFYALGALYDDRRDRSVLFWKSLPLSDTGTVLSKAAWALLLAPLLAIGVGLLIGLALWVVTALTLSVNGIPQSTAVFTESHPLRIIGMVLAALPVQVMWSLPAIGWLMLCSAWARSKPFLWAVLIPILGCVTASMMGILPMLNVNHNLIWYTVVYRGLLSVLPGSWGPVLNEQVAETHISGPQDLVNAIHLGDSWVLFRDPDMWIGAAVGVAFIVAAIYVRRWRDEA